MLGSMANHLFRGLLESHPLRHPDTFFECVPHFSALPRHISEEW